MINLRPILLSILVLATVTTGQTVPHRTYPQKLADGFRTTVASPDLRLHWLVTTLGAVAAAQIDQEVMARRDELLPDLLADFGDAWGGRWATLTILPIIFETDLHRGLPYNERARRLRYAATSLSMVGLITDLMKAAVGRERPNSRDHLSFPSGHTSISFGVAEVIRTLYGGRWGAVFYGAAVITGLSRIHDNKHYPSDVIAGAGLAIGLVRGFRSPWHIPPRPIFSWYIRPTGTVTALIRF